jgi:uncharacterized protein (TIGR02452 family)
MEGDDYYWDTYTLCKYLPIPESIVYDSQPMGRRAKKRPTIIFSPLGTLECAKIYDHTSVAIHNFANPNKPCWGVVKGMSQEEILFRQTNLGMTLMEEWYPITNKVIVSRDVIVMKDFGDGNFPVRKDHFNVDVITSAAINTPKLKKKRMNQKDHDHTEMILRWTLAAASQYDTFITGAWGCGLFNNPIPEMCEIWNTVLKDIEVPPTVIFAIPDNKLEQFKKYIEV